MTETDSTTIQIHISFRFTTEYEYKIIYPLTEFKLVQGYEGEGITNINFGIAILYLSITGTNTEIERNFEKIINLELFHIGRCLYNP